MATNGMWRSKLGNAFPRAEIERLDVEHHRLLKKLRSQPGNDRCAECGTKETTWSSVNLGVFLCVRCADVHRALGTHISKVKGCGGTYLWGPDEIALMQSLGNSAWSSDGVCAGFSTSKEELLKICREKYENKPLPVKRSEKLLGESSSTSATPMAACCSSARDGRRCAPDSGLPRSEAVPFVTKYPSQKTADKPLDLDSFLEECLQPAAPSSNASPFVVLDCTSTCSNHFQTREFDWTKCFDSEKATAAPASAKLGNSCQPNGVDQCSGSEKAASAPPSQGVLCKSISGFDFDSFFDECSNPSTQCNSLHSGNLEKPVLKQHKAFDSCEEAQMSLPIHPANPQPLQTPLQFDSDAFFDDIFSNTSRAVPVKTSSVVW